MDTVKKVTVRMVRREMSGAVWNPRTRWRAKVIVLAFVEDGNGRMGVGEAWINQGGAEAVKAIIENDFAPMIVGQPPSHARRFAHEVQRATEVSGRSGIAAAAWSALDIALWDLFARQLDLPLVDVLGRARDTVPVYASAGLYGANKTPDDLAAEVAGWVAAGFDAVKIKVGGAPLREDVARIAAVREAIGLDIRLMIDALYNCDAAGAIALSRAAEPYDIHFLEAPESPRDIAGQARVAAASPIPICGNESMAWAHYFRDLIVANAVHFVQFDIAACGGITEGKRIGELAQVFHLPATLHAASTSVLYAATLHLAASLPNCHSVEHHMLHQWYWDAAPEGVLTPQNAAIAPPPGPGIGVSLTPDDVD